MAFTIKRLKDTKGATAIEYALIASLISIAAIAAINGIGSTVSNTFDNVAAIMKN